MLVAHREDVMDRAHLWYCDFHRTFVEAMSCDVINKHTSRLEATGLEVIATSLEVIATRLEASLLGWRPL